MASNVKRYDMEDVGSSYMPHTKMVENPIGDYVEAQDYDALETRLATLEAERDRIARENYGLMLWLNELTGVSSLAIRETARSRADSALGAAI